MEFLNIGGPELIVLMLLGVIVLGPERLARVAREAGKLVRNLKAYLQSFSGELKNELDILDELKEIKRDINGR
jgi:sec-independent protein translocase protein TatB